MGSCKVCNDKGWYKDQCDCGGDDECFDCNGRGYVRENCHECRPNKSSALTVNAPINKNKVWGWIAGVAVGILAIILIDPSTSGSVNVVIASQYEVLSVYKGAVQVKDIQTGNVIQIFDNDLVRKALSGIIKKGDVIRAVRG